MSADGGHRGGWRGLGTFYSMGFWVAAIVSYGENHSILWLLVHGLFSWVFVIYAGLCL